ncbi:hypothetical protein Ancab_014732, partial [Ancistrocladus abbreviatus]
VQTAEYLKKKSIKSLKHTSFCKETEYSSSTAFRNGIKKRNERNLQQHQRLQKLYENQCQGFVLPTSCQLCSSECEI